MALAAVYRRWKYVEEASVPATVGGGALAGAPGRSAEADRIREAIMREESRITDCRRNGRLAMAREREATLRSLRNRLSALDL